MKFMANFKCNHTASSVRSYFQIFNRYAFPATFFTKHSLIFFPSFLALEAAQDSIQFGSVGTQNAYPAYNGAFSGEVGLEALESIGISTIMIGHSERRILLKESQDCIAQKFDFFARAGFEIVYCVGENLEVRKQGEAALQAYLRDQFVGIDTSYSKLNIAYEPIWAIGTGVSADIESITNTHCFLRTLSAAPLLYGGSVNPQNASSILAINNVDGVLVGSAALTPESFYGILKATKDI